MLNLHSEENVLFTGEVILSLRLEFCLFHYTSKFFSPLLRVWLWDWGVCFELGCPIFLCKKVYFQQSLDHAMRVKLVSLGNRAAGPSASALCCCSNLSSLCGVPSGSAGLLRLGANSVSPLL